MLHRRALTKIVAVLAIGCCLGAAAWAQSARTVGSEAFDRDPAALLNQPIRVARLGCFSTPGSGYRCTTYHGAYVLLGTVAPAAMKAKIDAECGGIVEAEDDPSCLFDVVFTPLSVGKGTGDIVKGDESVRGSVWMVRAATGTATLHR